MGPLSKSLVSRHDARGGYQPSAALRPDGLEPSAGTGTSAVPSLPSSRHATPFLGGGPAGPEVRRSGSLTRTSTVARVEGSGVALDYPVRVPFHAIGAFVPPVTAAPYALATVRSEEWIDATRSSPVT